VYFFDPTAVTKFQGNPSVKGDKCTGVGKFSKYCRLTIEYGMK